MKDEGFNLVGVIGFESRGDVFLSFSFGHWMSTLTEKSQIEILQGIIALVEDRIKKIKGEE